MNPMNQGGRVTIPVCQNVYQEFTSIIAHIILFYHLFRAKCSCNGPGSWIMPGLLGIPVHAVISNVSASVVPMDLTQLSIIYV